MTGERILIVASADAAVAMGMPHDLLWVISPCCMVPNREFDHVIVTRQVRAELRGSNGRQWFNETVRPRLSREGLVHWL